MYWIYRTQTKSYYRKTVQAILVDPMTNQKRRFPDQDTLQSPFQDEPYGAQLDLTFQVHSNFPHPDNYLDNVGFHIYSQKLIELMQTFKVKAEVFPIHMVDINGVSLPELKYYIFHSLEGVLPAMDEERSDWIGNGNSGIPRLVLNLNQFPHRPIFLCNQVYLPLMRDDVKRAIQKKKIAGFEFLRLDNYRSGKFGMNLKYDEQ